MQPHLQVSALSKSFDGNKVLHKLNFSLEKGTIHALVGGNGSGKTTLFHLITGFLEPDSGEIIYSKQKIIHLPPHKISQLGISRTFQDLRLIEDLTVKENVLLAFKHQEGEKWWKAIFPSSIYQKQVDELSQQADELLQATFLTEISEHKARDISYGQQKLLTLACVLASGAELLLLDEPVAGINVEYQEKIINILKNLKKVDKTILLIEHNHSFIRSVCNGVLLLKNGRIQQFPFYEAYTEAAQHSFVNENRVGFRQTGYATS